MGKKHDAAAARWRAGAAYAPIAESKKRWGAATQAGGLLRQALGTEDLPGLLAQAGADEKPARTALGETTGIEMTPLGYDEMVATYGSGGIDAYKAPGTDPIYREETLRVDPLKLVRAQAETTQFKIARRQLQLGEGMLMTKEERAEAVNRGHQGAILAEAQDKMLKAGIVESAGAAMRENMKTIDQGLKRGGAARRTAMEAMQKIDAHSKMMTERFQALTNAELARQAYGVQLSQQAVTFADAWAGSVPGLSESFNKSMDAVGQLFLTSSLPIITTQQEKGAAIRAQMHADNRARAQQIYSGIAAVVLFAAGFVTGGATWGMAATMAGQALSPSTAQGPTAQQFQTTGSSLQDWWNSRSGNNLPGPLAGGTTIGSGTSADPFRIGG